MMDNGEGRFTIVALLMLIAVALFPRVSTAQTEPPGLCGYAQCEWRRASLPNHISQCNGGPDRNCMCEIRSGRVALVLYSNSLPNGGLIGGPYNNCDCASKPDVPQGEGNVAMSAAHKRCLAGCLFTPKEEPGYPPGSGAPSTSSPDANGQRWGQADHGWRNDNGAQCNSYDDPAPETPPNPLDCSASGESCSTGPEKKPDQPPEFCGEIGGKKICADNGKCKGSAPEGYVCVGAPDAETPRPPPPPDGPPPGKDPDLSKPCIINGVPCEINFWPPPFGQPGCPAGQTRDANGACMPASGNPSTCPNGSQPVNGLCPAPTQNCSNGAQPINGTCPASYAPCPNGSQPVNGTCSAPPGTDPGGGGNMPCPNGQQPVNGLCTADYAPCPNGTTPVNGVCGVTFGTCPNGSQPVNGQCSPAACDPATDPQQCEGNDPGHASGGGTCAAPPACSGDPILCAVLGQQWQTKCAIEGLGKGTVTTDGRTGETAGDTQGVQLIDGDGMLGGISAQAFLGAGSCPLLPTFTAFGASYSFSDWDGWCLFLSALGGIIYFMGAFFALRVFIGE